MNPLSLAIDIGGSKCVVGLVSRDGAILAKRRFVWTELTASQVVDDIIREAGALLSGQDARPQVIGATIPGLTDAKRGIWVEASFSGIRNLPIARLLSDAFHLPAYIDNDGQACALAEKLFGSCRDTRDFLYVTVSNGIGGSIFVNGRLLGGHNGTAGEIGHCVAVEGGRPCRCGLRGCLEMHAAGPAILRNYQELGGTHLPDGRFPDVPEIAQLSRQGDKASIAAFQMEGEYLGKAIAMACNLLNPEKVIIGGGISLVFPLYEKALRETVQNHIYRAANPNLVIEPTALGYDGGLYGAAAVSFIRMEQDL